MACTSPEARCLPTRFPGERERREAVLDHVGKTRNSRVRTDPVNRIEVAGELGEREPRVLVALGALDLARLLGHARAQLFGRRLRLGARAAALSFALGPRESGTIV